MRKFDACKFLIQVSICLVLRKVFIFTYLFTLKRTQVFQWLRCTGRYVRSCHQHSDDVDIFKFKLLLQILLSI